MTAFGLIFEVSSHEISTSSTILLSIIGLMVLLSISKPMNFYKWIIWGGCSFCIVFSIIYLKNYFGIAETMSLQGILLCINFSIMTEAIFRYVSNFMDFTGKYFSKFGRKRLN